MFTRPCFMNGININVVIVQSRPSRNYCILYVDKQTSSYKIVFTHENHDNIPYNVKNSTHTNYNICLDHIYYENITKLCIYAL